MIRRNKNIQIGLLLFGIMTLLSHLVDVPDFILGFGIGISIVFELIGIYSINHDISKIRNYKKNICQKQ